MGKGFQRYTELREDAGVTDYKVAQDAGIMPSTLSDWKAGRYTPKVGKLVKIAKVLGCELTDLIDTEEVEG